MSATPKSPGKTETAARRKAKQALALRENLIKRRDKQKQVRQAASRPSPNSDKI